eukprot:gene4365-14488_t
MPPAVLRPLGSGTARVGKSSLLQQLTGTNSEVAAYEFTTLTCIPGIIHYNNSKIQLLDLPGIIEGASQGKGRGRQVIAVCKSADLLLMVLDALKPYYHKEILTRELESVGMRLNRSPPNVYFKQRKSGGISINSMVKLTMLDNGMIAKECGISVNSVVKLTMIDNTMIEYRIHHCELLFKEDCTVDDLIDVIEGNRRYVDISTIEEVDMFTIEEVDMCTIEEVDMCTIEEVDEIARMPTSIPISCHGNGLNLDGLLERMWEMMALVRVFTKKVGAKPDFSAPVVLTSDRGGTTMEALCAQIHKTLAKEVKYGLVWGTSSKHNPQRCGSMHILEDEDVVQIVKEKVTVAEDGRGRFKTTSDAPLRIADRTKKAALKT